MTLNTLLEEIKFGSEFIETKTDLESIQSFINEDIKIFSVSTRVDKLLRESDMNISYNKKLARAARNFRDYENKLFEDVNVSTVYAKMKVDSMIDDINSAVIELENKKTLRESNQETVGKVIAALVHGIDILSEAKNVNHKKVKELPGMISSYMKKELNLIKDIV